MRSEDRFLFLAARQRLEPAHLSQMEALAASAQFRWQAVFAAAQQNGIAPLLYNHVTAHPELSARLPDALREQYRRYVLRNIFSKQERARQLKQAMEFFRQNGICAIVLKGAAQELLVYEQPWYTVSFDIDLILQPRREEVPTELLKEIAQKFHRKRVEYDYFQHHDMNINGMLPVDFDAVWQAARPVDCYGAPGFVLSPEDHLLSLCINSCRKRFFRLKSLFDIHETIQKCAQLDWQQFCERCRRFDCGNIVFTALLVAALTLETPVPGEVMGGLGVPPARKALINAGVRFLLSTWSLVENEPRSRLFNRRVEATLVLPYLAYRPGQIWHKVQEIRAAQKRA